MKKRPKEKIADGKKTEENDRQFSAPPSGIIIWLDKLLIFLKLLASIRFQGMLGCLVLKKLRGLLLLNFQKIDFFFYVKMILSIIEILP